ncbi:MAG: translocation/assembly module TamB, partial [Muribaculaceae bacterium]|nr:translocation/assembly module TamB [Muribaculaceae bacterium]
MHHLIRPAWLRIPLKTLMWIVIVILLVPVLLYVPPVQTLVKNIACHMVRDKSGMDISIDRLRLRFPLDLTLEGVKVIEATGDTMATAGKAEIDVKLLPLLKLDLQLERLRLSEGSYRMVSPDSSMILRIKARHLEADDKSSVNLKNMHILLNEATLSDGTVNLYMDVWKKQPSPDTTSTQMLIEARKLRLDNFTFAMSMLPTIDTLTFTTKSLAIDNGRIDLTNSVITASRLAAARGNVVYLTPTPEYVAAHPAPVDTVSLPSPPMVIRGDSVSLDNFNVLYAVKGAKPLPGFDPSYISLSGLSAGVRDFYNAAATLRVPIRRLEGTERSGLRITEGYGEVDIDSTGLALEGLHVQTPWSRIEATAGLPFALMQMQPSAPLNVEANASIGWPDIEAFMPALATYTRMMPQRQPLNLRLLASGELGNARIERFDAAVPGAISLRASGRAANALDIKALDAALDFEGELSDPSLAKRIAGLDMYVPSLSIKGKASALRENYGAEFRLVTSAGNVAAKGKVAMNSERYDANVDIDNFNVAPFAPAMGVGHVTARLTAHGAGFNPEKAGAATDVVIDLKSAEYNRHLLRDLHAAVTLEKGVFTLDASSPNPACDFALSGRGTVAPDDYRFDMKGDLRHVDLMALGLSPTESKGSGAFTISGTASPARWLYDVDLDLESLDWDMAETRYDIPGGIKAKVRSTPIDTYVSLDGDRVALLFESPYNMKYVVGTFSQIASRIPGQIATRRVDMKALQDSLPQFRLRASANDKGLLAGLLGPSGVSMDSVWLDLGKDTIVKGRAELVNLKTASLALDTIGLRLSQRSEMLDYKLHIGNRPGTMDEFADVNLNGYLATNRLALSLTQHNLKGEQGYRLGLTAAVTDSLATLHFTPLSATIGYMPWRFNMDNHVDYYFKSHRIDANLQAKSNESSILLATEDMQGSDGIRVHLNLDNIKIEQFLNMVIDAPPLAGVLNTDLHLQYDGKSLEGNGDLTLKNLTYAKSRVGDFNLTLDAGRDNNGDTRATVGMKVDDNSVLALHTELIPDSVGQALQPRNTFLSLMDFPLSVANPFMGADVGRLSGTVSGRMDLTGTFANPVLNGQIACDNVGVFVAMLGSPLKFDEDPITVRDNILRFDRFTIHGANANPLTINGTVDATKFTNIGLDLSLSGQNFQLLNNNQSSGGDLYGKLFLDLDATAKGTMSLLNVNANVNLLGSSDVTYAMPMTADQLSAQQNGNVVHFVNFSDTTNVAKADSVPPSMLMRINATATITPGAVVKVIIPNSSAGSGRVQVAPSGTLTFYQNYMGDQTLNGTLALNSGYVRYKILNMVEKSFDFEPNSTIHWNGQMMNPILNIHAVNEVKANVAQGSNTQLVNFNVELGVTGTLSAPNVLFDLTTEDDTSIQNALQSMSADQRSTQAMNMLITGQYTGPGARMVSSNFVQGSLYSMLASQLNALAAKTIKGVDLSFGVDQYESGTNGETTTTTSYSYQVSKSLFNNRFKILVGGNYSTNPSADENFAENLISDISFEYMLRQTSTASLAARLFRHIGYENILEGEVTETGVGLVMKRRLSNLRSLFRLWGRKRRDNNNALPTDSTA